jgi:hypothetical protein
MEENNPDAMKVFRIDHDQVLEMLKLQRREGLRLLDSGDHP